VPKDIKENLVNKNNVLFNRDISPTEEFIEDLFDIDIRYHLKIDCLVKQDGFRNMLLRKILCSKFPLKINKSLKFFIVENEFDILFRDTKDSFHYEVYWKVRNRGEEAIKRDLIRGQIVKDKGLGKQIESTNFRGEHFVECYIVYKNVCIARDRIDVPIQI